MRPIDADALLEKLDSNSWSIDEWELPHEQVSAGLTANAMDRETVERMPTIDAVPVIRCRDCKFLRFTGTVWKCQNRLVMMLCEPNDYCSRAEREEE